MKMNLIASLIKMINEKKEESVDGTYVGAHFSKDTIKQLKKALKELKIPNPLAEEKFHTTIMYSTNYFDFEAKGKLDPPWIGTPDKLEIFPTQSGKNALVLRYKCDEQKDRFDYIMKNYNAKYTFPEYKIHLTLSYDCGDFDIKDVDIKKYVDKIEIVEEYSEPLKLDWNNDNDD